MQRFALVLAATAALTFTACDKSSKDEPTGASTTASGAQDNVKITDIDLGRSLDANNGIKDKTQQFKPNDTIYASVDTKGESPGTKVTATFKYQDGQVVHTDSVTIAPDGKERTEFHIQKPDGFPAGDYVVEIAAGTREPKSQKFSVN